jgi:hypothetical protein
VHPGHKLTGPKEEEVEEGGFLKTVENLSVQYVLFSMTKIGHVEQKFSLFNMSCF